MQILSILLRPSKSETLGIQLSVFLRKFVSFWLLRVFTATRKFPLVAVSWGYSLGVGCGLLMSAVSLVEEHGI